MSEVSRVSLLAIGVLVIVAGAGIMLAGYNQMQATQIVCDLVSGPYGTLEHRCWEEPVPGGGLKLLAGLVVILVGAVATRRGAR